MAGRIGLRETNFHVRVSRGDRDLIDRAAKLSGRSRSEFVIDAGRRAAQEVLREQRNFQIEPGEWERFVEALDTASEESPGLKALMARRAAWEK